MSAPANFSVLLTLHALSISQRRLKDPQNLEAVRQASDRIDYYPDGPLPRRSDAPLFPKRNIVRPIRKPPCSGRPSYGGLLARRGSTVD
jgi:hypothetical protein